jgi:hypothetical protein
MTAGHRFFGRWAFAAVVLCPALLSLLVIGCVKVRPSPYQLALERYYRGMLRGSTATELRAGIDGLTEDLRKDAADPGLHMLRTTARLELLRLGAQASPPTFDSKAAAAFFEDLRQTQSLLDQVGDAPLWMRTRIPTMFGDALLLQGIALSGSAAEAAEARARRQIVLLYLYRLAGDWFLQAGASAAQSLTDIKGKDSELLQRPGISRELDNARDGYLNALNGMAQSELFLRLPDSAREHLTTAQSLLTTTPDLPKAAGALSLSSLYAYPHNLLAIQARALEALTPQENIPARFQLRGTALREEVAVRLLSNPMQAVDPANLTDANVLALYLSSLTLEVANMQPNATGDAKTETVTFTLRPNALYRGAGIPAPLPLLDVQVGDEKRILRFPATTLAPFSVPAADAGVSITIATGAGVDTPPTKFFLRKAAPVLVSGKMILIKGPGDYTISMTTIP